MVKQIKQIGVSLTEEQTETLRETAKERGLTMSAFCRLAIFERILRLKKEEGIPQPA